MFYARRRWTVTDEPTRLRDSVWSIDPEDAHRGDVAERQLRDAMTPEQAAHEHQARIRHTRAVQDERLATGALSLDQGFGMEG
ncbi:hypothetical protein OR221_3224 [Microbacterium laevaniformans OR221]|nr:hypothetical protein OR221_3224 [Microbacterium laevaniformans OR221]